jgi:ribosomal protein S18 acetylase RimI-like enzyme
MSNLPNGLGLRPSTASDRPFIESLYASTRNDLRLIDGERDFVEAIVEMQYRAQTSGYGNQYPNAMYFVVEKLGERIGRVTIDFGPDSVHVVDIAFIPEARGKGYGTTVIAAIQQTAAQIKAPVLLSTLKSNLAAQQLYLKMGFQFHDSSEMHNRLIWYPNPQVIAGS